MFSQEILEEILHDMHDESLFEIVDEGDWRSDGKYDNREVIFKDLTTEKLYAFWASRTGSYYSEYEVQVDDAFEVKPVEVTIIQYERV